MRKTKLAFLALVLHAAYGCGSICPGADPGRRVFAAAWNSDAKTMRELLERKAPADGDTCWLQWGNRQAPLHIAAWHGDSEMVKLLLAHGATVDPSDKGAYTPLHLAAGSRSSRCSSRRARTSTPARHRAPAAGPRCKGRTAD